MTSLLDLLAPDPEVCELTLRTPPAEQAGSAPPAVLIEVPHGATRLDHFHAVRGRLRGSLPPHLEDYFLVNTDAGAPELALAVAERLATEGLSCLVLRCRVPRTLIDPNRELGAESPVAREVGLTPAIHGFVEDPADRDLLVALYRRYRAIADRVHEQVCGGGGLAVALHTYAPRSIQLDRFDAGIVQALRAAYLPETYRRWPLRPEVDLITRTPEGEVLADPGLVAAVARGYEELGLEVEENGTYTLLPGTVAATRSRRWPGRVLCLEVRRDLLADPWVPFTEVAIGAAAVARLAAPLASALLRGMRPGLPPVVAATEVSAREAPGG